jgi:hypothetical protein
MTGRTAPPERPSINFGSVAVRLDFPEAAVRLVEEDMIVETCWRMHLDPDSTAYVLAKHRHSSDLLGLVQVHGGGVWYDIRMRLERRRALLARWRP